MKKRKKFYLIISLLFAFLFIFAGCVSSEHKELIKRIEEYASSIYLVIWGKNIEYKIPSDVTVSRNEIRDEFLTKERKVIFINDNYLAMDLNSEDVKFLKSKLEDGFVIYFYDYYGNFLQVFAQKFNLKFIIKENTCNFLLKLTGDKDKSYSLEFSETMTKPFSNDTTILTVLERVTH